MNFLREMVQSMRKSISSYRSWLLLGVAAALFTGVIFARYMKPSLQAATTEVTAEVIQAVRVAGTESKHAIMVRTRDGEQYSVLMEQDELRPIFAGDEVRVRISPKPFGEEGIVELIID